MIAASSGPSVTSSPPPSALALEIRSLWAYLAYLTLSARRAQGTPTIGNLTRMPHLPLLDWDHAGRLVRVRKQVQAGEAPDNDVYSAHDAAGGRVRRIYSHAGATEERLQFGGYELFRKRSAAGSQGAG